MNGAIVGMTAREFSPGIIREEVGVIRRGEGKSEWGGDGLTVKVIGGGLIGEGGKGEERSGGGSGGAEVVASYAVDEHQLEIRLRIPPDWPLHRIEVKDEKRVGVDEDRWRSWVLGVGQVIWMHVSSSQLRDLGELIY